MKKHVDLSYSIVALRMCENCALSPDVASLHAFRSEAIGWTAAESLHFYASWSEAIGRAATKTVLIEILGCGLTSGMRHGLYHECLRRMLLGGMNSLDVERLRCIVS